MKTLLLIDGNAIGFQLLEERLEILHLETDVIEDMALGGDGRLIGGFEAKLRPARRCKVQQLRRMRPTSIITATSPMPMSTVWIRRSIRPTRSVAVRSTPKSPSSTRTSRSTSPTTGSSTASTCAP